MPILLRDYETKSALDLKRAGARCYAEHPSTDVLCAAYCVDDGPVQLWKPGDPTPPEWIEAASDPTWIVSAFNDFFERMIETHVLAPRYGWPTVPIEQHRCLQAAARSLALPGKLEKTAAALSLTHQKDMAGHKKMLSASKPRKAKKGEGDGPHWNDDSATLASVHAYCVKDGRVEQELQQRLGFLPPSEQAVWLLDAAINDRGVFIDEALAQGARAIDKTAHAAIDAELATVTGGAVKTARQEAELKKWLVSNGCGVPDIQKETLRHALARKGLSPEVRRAIELRRDGAHAASDKFNAMMNWRASTGRAHGCFQYHGASTGRWSSHGIQVQNLKKSPPDGVDAAVIEAVKTGNLEHLRSLYPDDPLSAVGDITRAGLCAAPGHIFIDADFSGIESRVTAWLAGEQSKLDQWAKFDLTHCPEDEPYFINGQRFGLPPEAARASGKVGDLAFGFAGGKGAYYRTPGADPNTPETQVESYKNAWRAAHPAVVKFWADIWNYAIDAVLHPGKTFDVNPRISWRCDDDSAFLRMRLPSGRSLAYPFPSLIEDDNGFLILVHKDVNIKGGWVDATHFGRPGTWKGKLCENAVQACARDLFAEAMPRLEAAKYNVVLHLHDEILAEVPRGFGSVDEFLTIITEAPDWAADLPIAAKGDARGRFCKIKPVTPNPPLSNPPSAKLPISEPREAHGLGAEAVIGPANTCDDADNTQRADREPDYIPGGADYSWTNTMRNRDGYQYSNGEDHPSGPYTYGAAYIYRDEHGQNFMRTTRRINGGGEKTFPQQHWENGKWVPGKPKAPKILYRLPEFLAAAPEEPVFICEGEKDAESVAGLGLVATTNSEGATRGKWTAELNAAFVGRKTAYILEDNDETGRAHVNEVADNLRGIVPEIRIVNFRELPEHGDVSDWLNGGGHTAEELLARAKAGRVSDYRFKLVPFGEITLNTTPSYLIKDLLPRIGLAVFWGPPKCGKSFFVFDLMMHVALGWRFRDLKVKQGAVVYCALEGGEAFRNRKEAFRLRKLGDHGGDVPFYLMAAPLALVTDHPALIASIKGQCAAPAAVVIDTLNRSLEGSESSDEDMGNYVKAADAIREAFGCVVPVVHHCGYDATHPRGHTSLAGAVDMQAAITRDADNNVIATVEYLKDGKDGPEGAKLISKLEVVNLGLDDDGDEITSCIVVPVTADSGSTTTSERAWAKGKAPKGAAKIAHEALFEVLSSQKALVPEADPNIPAGRKCVKVQDWMLQSIQKGICTAPAWRSKEQAFRRASLSLVAEHLVGIWQEYAWIITI